jgi:transcription elongation factor Elf1
MGGSAVESRPTFEFTCPSCGDPFATTKESFVDIHSGATYTCAVCDERVIFEVFTAEQYVARFETGFRIEAHPTPPTED